MINVSAIYLNKMIHNYICLKSLFSHFISLQNFAPQTFCYFNETIQ
jgi:hypothetical protein